MLVAHCLKKGQHYEMSRCSIHALNSWNPRGIRFRNNYVIMKNSKGIKLYPVNTKFGYISSNV